MTPPPSIPHQRFERQLQRLLEDHAVRNSLGEILANVGVRDPKAAETNYRVPDLVFVSKDRASIVGHNWIDGGPDLAVEIGSPGDETYDKRPFYARLSVKELQIFAHPDRQPELYRLAGEEYVAVAEDPDGWLPVRTLGIRVRRCPKTGDVELAVGRDLIGRIEIPA